MTWIQTYSGARLDILNPRAKDIHLIDITMPLSRACRYAGHCLRFYSVAEHCVLAAEIASNYNKLAALMHDASEAYIVDIPRPIKPLLAGYYEIEDRIMRVIADKYGFEWPLPVEVKEIDTRLLSDEREQNMKLRPEGTKEWGNPLPGAGVRLRYWRPEEAKFQFMSAFYELTQ